MQNLRGCDTARKVTWQSRASPCWAYVAWARGRGHASPRGRPGGTTWQSGGWHLEGPWVCGPWLGVWGGNANALRRPLLYTHLFRFLSPYGTMFLWNFSFEGDMAAQWASDTITMRPWRGRGVHRIVDQTRAQKGHLSEVWSTASKVTCGFIIIVWFTSMRWWRLDALYWLLNRRVVGRCMETSQRTDSNQTGEMKGEKVGLWRVVFVRR